MDPLRNPGATRSPDTSPEPHRPDRAAAPARRERSPTPGALDEGPLPRRARLDGTEAGPSALRPFALQYALLGQPPPVPPNPGTDRPGSRLQEAGPSSPAPPLRPGASVSAADPSQRRLAAHERMRALLAELEVPTDPGPTDLARLWTQCLQQPQLASRFARVFRQMLRHANTEAPESIFDFPISLNQFILSRSLLTGLDGLRQLPDMARTNADRDTDEQREPLGHEIQAWSQRTGAPIDRPHAFDHDDNAVPFARVLARLRDDREPVAREASERTNAQVASMLQAIADDAALRSEVFALARDALGSCGDNLAEGFSRMVLAVDSYRMVRAVERGEVDAKRLDDWARALFRLSLLETAVSRHIASRLRDTSSLTARDWGNLTQEPLETMVHAKVALRESLGLPGSAVSTIEHENLSALKPDHLAQLERDVWRDAQNPAQYSAFLLQNPAWCAGMKALHPREFQDLIDRRDDDPFHDLDLPADTDVAAQADYAEQALQVQTRYADEERALLLRLAAEHVGPQEAAAESSRSR